MYQNQANQSRSETKSHAKESVVDVKKLKQKKTILKELYLHRQKTIWDLSQILSLSIPSTTSILEELCQEEWIRESGLAVSKQGRRPAVYELNQQKNFTLVLDINTRETNVAIINLKNEIIHSGNFPLPIVNNPNFISNLIVHLSNFFIQKAINNTHILAVGISVPGLINRENGKNYTYPIIDQTAINHFLATNFDVPVFILNNYKASAYGEFRLGTGKGKKHILSFNADDGIGLGIVINGEIFDGANGFSGELGHIQVNPDGELCSCGKNGCLNTLTSTETLFKIIQKKIQSGQSTKLHSILENPEKISIDTVIEAAKNGDIFSIDLLHSIGSELGKGLAFAVQMFNPQVIIIGGALSKAKKLIINPIEHTINKFCTSELKEGLSIEVSELGDVAKIFGIHAHVTENMFSI